MAIAATAARVDANLAAAPQPHKRSKVETGIGIAVPAALSVLSSYGTFKAMQAMRGSSGSPVTNLIISGAMGAWMGKGALERMSKRPEISAPPDTGRTRAESVRDGALLGAATLGLTATAVMAFRSGGGAVLAGGGPVRVATTIAKTAAPWALAAGATGAALGAAAGLTAREPEAVIDGVADQAFKVGRNTAMVFGGIAAVGGGLAAGLMSKNVGKGLKGAAVAGVVGGSYMGILAMTNSATFNAAAAWANTPKR